MTMANALYHGIRTRISNNMFKGASMSDMDETYEMVSRQSTIPRNLAPRFHGDDTTE
jgi:hypothetical protein